MRIPGSHKNTYVLYTVQNIFIALNKKYTKAVIVNIDIKVCSNTHFGFKYRNYNA